MTTASRAWFAMDWLENFLVGHVVAEPDGPLIAMTRCPVGFDPPKGHDSYVIEGRFIGCGKCACDCPYGNINVVEVTDSDRRQKAEPRQWRSMPTYARISRAELRARLSARRGHSCGAADFLPADLRREAACGWPPARRYGWP